MKITFGIRGRLLLGFTIVSIVLLTATMLALYVVQRTENIAAKVITVDLPLYDNLLALSSEIYKIQSSLQLLVLNKDQAIKTTLTSSWNHVAVIQQSINDKNHFWADQTDIAAWQQVQLLIGQLKNTQDKVLNSVDTASNVNAINLLSVDFNGITQKIMMLLDGDTSAEGQQNGLFGYQYQILQTGTNEITNMMFNIKVLNYTLMFIIVFISIIVSTLTARSILKPLNNAIDIAKSIATGKRDITIHATSNDETGELLKALDVMQKAIEDNEEKIKQSEKKISELFDNIVHTATIFSDHSSKVAGGDLRQHLEVTGDDVMAKLGKDLNVMTEGLATITVQITGACQNMVTTLEEVKHAVDVQSSGATEQASSINEITSSLDEIEKSSSQTMEKAKALGDAAERTREKGQQGLEAVEQSVQGMKAVRDKVQVIAQTILDLSNQTQQVGEITAVVNTLAQQSKMLALNASIEAAKAGEAGKGFAVVASEVKALAEQSEQSTSQVQKILENIRHAAEKAVMVTEEGTKGVDYGTSLVEQTGEIVRNLRDVIHETTIASQQIEAAVRQESIGIEQITAGMNEINQVTSTFVESAKQTNEAISNLSSIAKNLKERVDTYKV